MSKKPDSTRRLTAVLFVLLGTLPIAGSADAHCDSMDGPVVRDAMRALSLEDVTPLLKWIGPGDEPELRGVFERTLIVRSLGEEARLLADRHLFETAVRLHRAAEGEPFTGLKPAGTDPGPVVTAADEALDAGSADVLVGKLTEAVETGLRDRFERARSALGHADESVEAGRLYVAAYVRFVHYAEHLFGSARGSDPSAALTIDAH